MRTAQFELFPSTSLGASFNSNPIRCENMYLLGVQIVVSGASSLNGAFKLQVSNDNGFDTNSGPGGVTGLTNWTDVASSSQTVTADGTVYINYADVAAPWVRVVYTRTGGTGNAVARVNLKGD